MTFLISKTQIFNTQNSVLLAPASKVFSMINSDHHSFMIHTVNDIDMICVLVEKTHKNTIASPFVCGDIVYEMIVKFCEVHGISL